MKELKRGETFYFARAIKGTDIYKVLRIHIRTVDQEEKWFTGVEVEGAGENIIYGQVHLFYFKDIGRTVFDSMADANKVVEEAEKSRVRLKETYFEED